MINVAIFGRSFNSDDQKVFREFVGDLEKYNVRIGVYGQYYDVLSEYSFFSVRPLLLDNYSAIHDFAHIMISVGGDGTLLQSITLVRGSGIPVLGLNLGRLGFLSGISCENMCDAVKDLVQGNYVLEERTLLNVNTGGNIFGDMNFALNDLTVHKYESSGLIVLDVFVDEVFLNSYWADGLIISTPTGSTGYSLSCQGPIVTPDSSNFIITPVATHNLTVRPIVLPDTCQITVKPRGRDRKFFASLDSRMVFIQGAEEFKIRKEAFTVKLICLPGENFFNTIRTKLNWGLDNRN